jgi:hypothetical protein
LRSWLRLWRGGLRRLTLLLRGTGEREGFRACEGLKKKIRIVSTRSIELRVLFLGVRFMGGVSAWSWTLGEALRVERWHGKGTCLF